MAMIKRDGAERVTRRSTVAAVLLGVAGLSSAVPAAFDLAVLSMTSGREAGETPPASVAQALVTVLPILKALLFAPATKSMFPLVANALFCGAGAALMAVAAVLVARRRPLGALLVALLGPCLAGFSWLAVLVRLYEADRYGAPWYVWPVLLLGVLSYVMGLAAIPRHRNPYDHPGADHAFARRALTASALGLATVTAAGYAWYVAAEHLLGWYVWEPPAPAMILAVLVTAGLAVVGLVVHRRGASKGVLIGGGLAAFPFLLLMVGLLTGISSMFVPALIVGVGATVLLLAGLVRLVGAEDALTRPPAGPAPAQAGAEGRAPAALIGSAIWAGPVITALGVVGIDEARHIAYEDARLKGEEIVGFPDIGDMFLKVAAEGVRTYAVLYALAAVGLAVLARRVRRRGGTPGTQTAVFAAAVVYLILLSAAGTITPFFIGDSDEPVHTIVVDGPVWYMPAVRTILACSAAALVAGLLLLIRRPAVHTRAR